MITPVSSARVEIGEVRTFEAEAGDVLHVGLVTAGFEKGMGTWSSDIRLIDDLALQVTPPPSTDGPQAQEGLPVAQVAVPRTRLTSASRRPVIIDLRLPAVMASGTYTVAITGKVVTSSHCGPATESDTAPVYNQRSILANVTIP